MATLKMTTPEAKHLIELMIEARIEWPATAKYAAQDRSTNKVCFYKKNPEIKTNDNTWSPNGYIPLSAITLLSLCRDWRQTIVTREQYEQALVATVSTTQEKNSEFVMRQVPDSTIEQLTADYHAKVAEADRLQSVANEALKAADDALLMLKKAGELIGLIISIDAKLEKAENPEITDWRDLKIGDVIQCVAYGDSRDGEPGRLHSYPGGWAQSVVGSKHIVGEVNSENGRITLSDVRDSGYAFRFICRPHKSQQE